MDEMNQTQPIVNPTDDDQVTTPAEAEVAEKSEEVKPEAEGDNAQSAPVEESAPEAGSNEAAN